MALVKLFGEVFEMKDFSLPQPNYLQNLLERPNFDVFVALDNNHVVGGLTTYVLEQYYSEKPLAYIYDLAVASNLQRQGIGKQLIAEVNAFYTKKGFEEMYVQADKVDAHAVDFYRKTMPTEEVPVINFNYTLHK